LAGVRRLLLLLRLRLTAVTALPAAITLARVALTRVGLAGIALELATLVTALPGALRRLSRGVGAIRTAPGELPAVFDSLRLRLGRLLRLNDLGAPVRAAAGEAAAVAEIGASLRLLDGLRRLLRLAHGAAFAALELSAGLIARLRRRLRGGLGLSLRLRALWALTRLLCARGLVVVLAFVAEVARLRQRGSRHQRQGQRHKGDALHAVTPRGPR